MNIFHAHDLIVLITQERRTCLLQEAAKERLLNRQTTASSHPIWPSQMLRRWLRLD